MTTPAGSRRTRPPHRRPAARSAVPRRREASGGRLAGVATTASLIFVLTACEPPREAPSSSAPPRQSSLGQVRTVTEDLQAPWSIAFTEQDRTPLVSERDSARILELDDAGQTREVGIVPGVEAGGEGGLLGIAVREGYLYACFTTGADNRIERFELTGEPGSFALGQAQSILDGIPAAGIHNGGRLAFGPDGMLYATTGDAGDTGNGQDRDALAGKILRMTPDGAVPEDNPFEDSLTYSYGHRNPQGLAWAPDGTLYAAEFGQDTWDELNEIEPGGNYGWPVVEGIADDEAFIDPLQQWQPSQASPSGIAVAGDSIFVANLRGQLLRQIPLADTASAVEHFDGEHGRLRDAVLAPDGSLWVLTSSTDGRGRPGPGDDRILRVELEPGASANASEQTQG